MQYLHVYELMASLGPIIYTGEAGLINCHFGGSSKVSQCWLEDCVFLENNMSYLFESLYYVHAI